MRIITSLVKAFYYIFIEIYRIKLSLIRIIVVEVYYKAYYRHSNITLIKAFNKSYLSKSIIVISTILKI